MNIACQEQEQEPVYPSQAIDFSIDIQNAMIEQNIYRISFEELARIMKDVLSGYPGYLMITNMITFEDESAVRLSKEGFVVIA
ncbi:MAG: hypothetical protein ACD_15C00138G0015 [uncultured bacterium]|nr:MAG: hypothetical protein ACD_15C00138G0015 [uncultured bacterium]HCU71167.1 hypothetical protein [Candidatus Moranbacteria bacterium]